MPTQFDCYFLCNPTFISSLCNLTCMPCFTVESISFLIMGTVTVNIDCQLNEIYNNHGSKSLGRSVGGLSRLIELRRFALCGRYHSTGWGLGYNVTSCLKRLLR